MGPGEPITPADERRFRELQELGCIVCLMFLKKPETPGDIHHLLDGGRRIGHQSTICLHPWFHRGDPPEMRLRGTIVQLTIEEATRILGPSMKHDKRAFEHRFATEMELLEYSNILMAKYSELRDGGLASAA